MPMSRLGDHYTVIHDSWLIHQFFVINNFSYLYILPIKYDLFIIVLCMVVSIIIMSINIPICKDICLSVTTKSNIILILVVYYIFIFNYNLLIY